MIGDQHFYTATTCFLHAGMAGYAVIYGDDDVGRFFTCGQFNDFGCEPITVFKTIRDDVINARTHGAQTPQCDGASGSTIAIVVGHHGEIFFGFDGIS